MIRFNWLKNRYTLGVYVGLSSVRAALIETASSSVKPRESVRIDYPEAISSTSNYAVVESTLKTLVEHYAYHFNRHYLPVQVAVADPLISSALFELEKIPARHSLKNDLLAMRFKNDCHVDTQGSIIASQEINGEKSPGLYAVVARESLVNTIEHVIMERAPLSCIDKSIHFVFNYFYPQLSAASAMLYLNDEYWTLLIWNESKLPVYIRSKQRVSAQGQSELVEDVQRLLHTYQQNEQKPLNRLYVIDSGDDSSFTTTLSHATDISIEALSSEVTHDHLQINDVASFAAVPV